MWDQVKQAAREGVILGVKWGVVLLIIGFLVAWAVTDYTTVRQRAYNGEIAFEAIQQAQAQAQQRASAPAFPPAVTPPAVKK